MKLKVSIKNRTWYYFDKITKFENFHFGKILLEKNHTKII